MFLFLTISLPLSCEAGKSIWSVGKFVGNVEERKDLPSPAEFHRDYFQNIGGEFEGLGKPVVFPGAAKRMPAFSKWTDEYLREKHGSVKMDQVETEKRETRTAYPHEDWTLARFLDEYNHSEIYSTATTPKGLSDEVFLLPPINCGGFNRRLAATVTWFSSGGTRSVIHSDSQQNFHCMFAGSKDWILWRPNSGIATEEMGWVHAEEEAKTDPQFKDAYGAYVGRIDADDVDLGRFPKWDQLEWWNMTLSPGDCAYIPAKWFHYVESRPGRSISVHTWFRASKKFSSDECEKMEEKGYDVSDFLYRIGDCTWGFGEDGDDTPTKCKLRKSLARGGEL